MKKKILFVLKLLISAALLFFVIATIDFPRVRETLARLPWWYFALSSFLHVLLLALGTLRWWLLAPGANLKRLLMITFGSQHLTFIIPSSVTYDAIRVWSVRSDTSGASGTIGAIIIDKIGGIAAVLVVWGGSGLLSQLPPEWDKTVRAPAAVATALGFILILILSTDAFRSAFDFVSNSRLGRSLFDYFPANVREAASNERKVSLKISRKRVLLNIGIAILFQWVALFGYWLMALAFHFQLTISQMLFVSTLIQIIMFLPLSIAGVGLKDLSIVYALGLFGVGSNTGFAASISGYPILVVFAIIGWILSNINVAQRNKSFGA